MQCLFLVLTWLFSWNNIGCLELAKFLCENNEVIECNVCRNNINDEGVKHLCDALKNENCKLTNLNVNISVWVGKYLGDAAKIHNVKLPFWSNVTDITMKGVQQAWWCT